MAINPQICASTKLRLDSVAVVHARGRIACKPGFFLHVRVLSRLFRRWFLDGLQALHRAGELTFYGDLERQLAKPNGFAVWPADKTQDQT